MINAVAVHNTLAQITQTYGMLLADRQSRIDMLEAEVKGLRSLLQAKQGPLPEATPPEVAT